MGYSRYDASMKQMHRTHESPGANVARRGFVFLLEL
jgi:hypothetical protein